MKHIDFENPTKYMNNLIVQCNSAFKVIRLTGTIFFNSVSDLAVLVNIVKGETVLPERFKVNAILLLQSDF